MTVTVTLTARLTVILTVTGNVGGNIDGDGCLGVTVTVTVTVMLTMTAAVLLLSFPREACVTKRHSKQSIRGCIALRRRSRCGDGDRGCDRHGDGDVDGDGDDKGSVVKFSTGPVRDAMSQGMS